MFDIPIDKFYLLLATILYGLGFIYGFIILLQGKRYQGLLLLGFIIGGFFLQTLGLNIRGATVKACPLGNLFEVLQFISWSLIMAFILIRYVLKLKLLGLFTTGLACSLNILSHLFPHWDKPYEESPFAGNHWIELHAALAVFSYGIYALMGVVAIMYLIQHYSLKLKLPSKVYNFLPSISDSLNACTKIQCTALIFYSLSCIVGSVYWAKDFASISLFKISITLLLWLFSFILLIIHRKHWVYGKQFVILCFLLFSLSIVSLIKIEKKESKNDHSFDSPAARTPHSADPS